MTILIITKKSVLRRRGWSKLNSRPRRTEDGRIVRIRSYRIHKKQQISVSPMSVLAMRQLRQFMDRKRTGIDLRGCRKKDHRALR